MAGPPRSGCGLLMTPCWGSAGVTIVVLGASSQGTFAGGLIYTAVGKVSSRGGPCTKRSGWAA